MTDREHFATTNWSIVRAAGNCHSESSRSALEELFKCYWFPMYAYVRRRGRSESESKDMVQSFVAVLLERNDFAIVGPERGKFRTFLLTSLQNFLSNDFKRKSAQKRGGDTNILSFDFENAERRLPEPSVDQTPEMLFEKEWGLSLLSRTLDDLKNEYETANKLELFEEISKYLTGATNSTDSYRETGIKLNLSESAVKSAVFRMRQSYRQQLRGRIAQTVEKEEEIDDEIRDLFRAVQI